MGNPCVGSLSHTQIRTRSDLVEERIRSQQVQRSQWFEQLCIAFVLPRPDLFYLNVSAKGMPVLAASVNLAVKFAIMAANCGFEARSTDSLRSSLTLNKHGTLAHFDFSSASLCPPLPAVAWSVSGSTETTAAKGNRCFGY